MSEGRILADRVLVAAVGPNRALVGVDGQRETEGAAELAVPEAATLRRYQPSLSRSSGKSSGGAS
jgi:hypothetical protein